jgi:type IV secretion system protein VirD4
MSFASGFYDGRAAASAVQGQASASGRDRSVPDVAATIPPINFGYYLDRVSGRTGIPLLYGEPLHIVLIGVNGAGKQTRILTRVYMSPARMGRGGAGRSMFIVETKGTAALQTADERRKYSDTRIVCPHPVLGLKSDGWNPLRYLDPKSPYFLGDCRALARAMIDIEAGTGMHWTESATGLVTALIMWEVIEAKREWRTPSLLNVRMRLTEPDKTEWFTAEDGARTRRLVAGLSMTAARMIDEGGPVIASLIGRFVREHGKNEIASIQSTADTQTQFLLNPFIAADLAKGKDVDLSQLSQRPMSIYWVCAAGELEEFRRHTRMGLSFAVRAHLQRPSKMRSLFVMDEYRSTVGKLGVVADNWALVREYGVQFLVCVQSALHLKALHGEEWQNIIGQAGIVATIGPIGDPESADFFSKRCGVTMELRGGFNVANGINTGDGANSGTAMSNSGPSSNEGFGRNYGTNRSGTFTVQQVERPAVRPQELMNLWPGEGRIWLQGIGTESFPFFAPHYWQCDGLWARAVKPNPYYQG